MALLAARNTGDVGTDGLPYSPTWLTASSFTVTTTGTVTSVKVKVEALIVGNGNLEVNLLRGGDVIGTGSIATSGIATLPTPAAFYEITISESPGITATESLIMRLRLTTGPDIGWWRNQGGTANLLEVHGTAYSFTPPVATTANNMKTNKRLVAVGDDKFWYEDI